MPTGGAARRDAAGHLQGLVYRAWLDTASAPAGAHRAGGTAPVDAADRADGRRQDAGRAFCRASSTAVDRAAVSGRRPAHALHLAAEGAGRRRRPQPARRRSPRWASPSASRRAPATRRPSKRQRQRLRPPEILLTTPEQLALLLAHRGCGVSVRRSRGGHPRRAARHGTLEARRSAGARPRPAAHARAQISSLPAYRRRWRVRPSCAPGSSPQADARKPPGTSPISLRSRAAPSPRSPSSRPRTSCRGPATRRAMPSPRSWRRSRGIASRCVFVNTRMQAELMFQELWRINEASLPIALHHGSLDVAQRRKVEAAMAAGKLRAVVATSTLDLGIDWGDVDLVLHIGAPKGASRLIQRIGRANHRLDEPSKAILVPANRFEVLECRAALEAAEAGAQDAVVTRTRRASMCSRSTCWAWPAPGHSIPPRLFRRGHARPLPYARPVTRPISTASSISSRPAVMRCAPTSGSRACARPTTAGCASSHPRLAQQYRLNVGTIVESPMLKVRLVGRKGAPRPRHAAANAADGRPRARRDRRVFRGRAEARRRLRVRRRDRAARRHPRDRGLRLARHRLAIRSCRAIPAASSRSRRISPPRVRAMLADPSALAATSARRRPLARACSASIRLMPAADEVLVETFPQGDRHHLVAYPFEGRLAHQTLGMLLTRRLERPGARPLGFRRQRLCAVDLGPWRSLGDDRSGRTRSGAPVRRGHARRRSRGLARRDQPDAADVPPLRDHRRTDRAAASRQGEVRPPAHGLLRPDLRCAAPP